MYLAPPQRDHSTQAAAAPELALEDYRARVATIYSSSYKWSLRSLN